MGIVRAPWTPEQVERLAAWQAAGHVHPFTCGPCRDRDTEARIADGTWPTTTGPEFALIPTVDGWVCGTCDYTQDWCFTVMLGGPGRDPFDVIHEMKEQAGG
jgi:hypothetical protein